MRAISTVLGVVLLAGCGSGLPNRFSGPAPAQAMSCVTQRLTAAGYQALGGGANSGSVRLERMNDEPWWLEVLGFNDSVDVVDVISTSGQLQVNVYSQVLNAGQRSAAAPNEDARAQANEIFSACT